MASIEKRANPSGAVVHRVVWRYDHRKQSMTFDDERDAKRCRALVESLGNQIDKPGAHRRFYGLPEPVEAPPGLTLGEWAATWLDTKTGVQVDTVERYRRQWERKIRDAEVDGRRMADHQITAVSPLTIRRWMSHLDGMHPATVRRYHGVLHQMMRDAAREGHIVQNPCAYTDLPDEDEDTHAETQVFLTRPEAQLLLAALKPSVRDFVVVLLGTGLRWGEITALQTRDVDLMAKTPHIKVQRVWKHAKAKGWYLGAPKSKRSRRSVSVSPEVVEILARAVDLSREDAFVFTAPRGGRLDHAHFMRGHWRPAVAKVRGELGKSPTPHDLRHTHASWLIADGVHLVKVSRRLGHSSVAVTEQVYVHLLPDDDSDLLAGLDRALQG